MSLFSKKKLYKVKWSYGGCGIIHVDIVMAKNPANAWKKIKKDHSSASAVSLEEI